MMSKKLYLGRLRDDFQDLGGEAIYLSKHSWDCDWYWGMGYIGNKDLHSHFKSTFLKDRGTYDIKDIFSETKLTQSNWWSILEMFETAYALREAADLYHRGGSRISTNLCREKLKDEELATRLNKDLEEVLDTVWRYIEVSIESNLQAEIDDNE